MTSPNPHPITQEISAQAPWMRRLARALVGEDAAADDLVQDVWTRVGREQAFERDAKGASIRSRAGCLAAVLRSLALR